MTPLILGAAYYDEYNQTDRLEKDLTLMNEAGLNTIRIAESTWSVEEPVCGEFDFSGGNFPGFTRMGRRNLFAENTHDPGTAPDGLFKLRIHEHRFPCFHTAPPCYHNRAGINRLDKSKIST